VQTILPQSERTGVSSSSQSASMTAGSRGGGCERA
jgi:hypothetical protein